MSFRHFPILALALLGFAACSKPDVTIRIALDRDLSEPIIKAFEEETGLTVRAIYDVEASKTVGHVKAIYEEAGNPKCDVFWNNEIVHTVRLKKDGLLEPYRSESADDIPPDWKDPDGAWTGFAARARVFILHEPTLQAKYPNEADWPKSTMDLLGAEWKGAMGIARPLAGTTLTHMAVLWTLEGEEWVKEKFWRPLREHGVRVTTGNAHLMREVSKGNFAFGYTDTDDFRKALLAGKPVRMVYPDQEPGGEIDGCLVIPNTIAMIKDCPQPENAKRLIDFILRKDVERRLAEGPSAQIPSRGPDLVPRPDHVKTPERTLEVKDWDAVADAVKPFMDWYEKFEAQ